MLSAVVAEGDTPGPSGRRSTKYQNRITKKVNLSTQQDLDKQTQHKTNPAQANGKLDEETGGEEGQRPSPAPLNSRPLKMSLLQYPM